MTRHVRLRELLVGVEGLALMRQLYDGSDEDARRRCAEIQRMLDDERFAASESISEAEPSAGYREWSHRYDEPGNPIVELEQSVLDGILRRLPPGSALDAACGTGRHALALVAGGHRVLGIDLSPEMLERARRRVPGATFVQADLRALPASSGQFDVVVCGLALAHLEDLEPGVRELARVLRGGGRMVISVLHPMLAFLGWQAPYPDPAGGRRFVREHPHDHAAYLSAFRATGLSLRGCFEPRLGAEHLPTKRRAFEHAPEATRAAYLGLPAVLVWELEKDP